MVARWTPYLYLLAGVLLLTTPALWQPGADYTTVTYEAEQVEYTDDYLRTGSHSQLDGLDCYGVHPARNCALEAYIAQNGPVTVSGVGVVLNRSSFVATNGHFYRTEQRESGENLTLDLTSVTPDTVLKELSRPADTLPEPAREAVNTGESVTVRVEETALNRHERESSYFVSAGGSYYVLRETYTAHDGVDSPLETPSKVVLFASGLGFVLRGQTKRNQRTR